MFLYYAHAFGDTGLRWWVDLLDETESETSPDPLSNIRRMYVRDTLRPVLPDLPPDKVFPGIGWAAFHSDITRPENDLILLFKSSPYGSASHSHCDQNSFAIMKGGKALAIPAGARYPQHGSPFHREYNRLTLAHNALLINGKGQLDRDHRAYGMITDFKSLPHIGYAAGDAQKAYGPPVRSYLRHVLMIRPSLLLIVDELEAEEPVTVDWLLHGKEKFRLDEESQQLTSLREDLRMDVLLLSEHQFRFSQTNEWPMDPKQDYPMVTEDPPAKQWHFTGHMTNPSKTIVIVALMSVNSPKSNPGLITSRELGGKPVTFAVQFKNGNKAHISINLISSAEERTEPLIRISYDPALGEIEELIIQ
jgi:hypothetical protein